ncbi:Hypothetical protein, putative, partial [Bodo saltans]
MPFKRTTSVMLDDNSADGTLSGTAAGALLKTIRNASVNPYQYLHEEFHGRHADDDSGDDSNSVELEVDHPHDFYAAHAHLLVPPSQRADFYLKRDGNNNASSPTSAAPETASSPKNDATATTSPSLQHEQVYPLRFPQSLYGPLGERLPKITLHQLNHPQTAHQSNTAPTPSTVTPLGSTTNYPGSKKGHRSGATLLETVSSMGGGHMSLNVEDRTLFQLAEASLTAASTRHFAAEWNQALTMGLGTLSIQDYPSSTQPPTNCAPKQHRPHSLHRDTPGQHNQLSWLKERPQKWRHIAGNSVVNGRRGPYVAEREDRTLYQLAEASLTAASTRHFAAEWNQALTMGLGTLSMISARQHKLCSIANAFSEVVSPIACAIVESRNQAPSQRPYRPLPSMDNVYIVKGHVYVISECPARVKLFGSSEAAGRAANNEIRALSTILGNPFLGVHTALSCVVTFMGLHVFVTAPISLPVDPEQALVLGGFRPDRVAVGSGAIYPSYKMGEYLPLLRHPIPTKSLFAGPAPVPESRKGIVTPCDLKFVYEANVGSLFVIDAARYLPPAVCHTQEFSKAKTKDDGLGVKGVSRHPLENEAGAHLSVLFRPEFMFATCPIQLNTDANTPHQPQNSQEPISHAIHTLYSSNCWHLATDLVQAEQNKALPLSEISNLFHKHGVNLRYIGKVYNDIDAAVKTNEARESVKRKLALEASCRTFKAVVFNRFNQEHKHRGEESLIVAMFRNFLFCNETLSEAFWEETIRPTMERKFGFYKRVVQQGNADSQNDDVRSSLLNDGSALNIYHCLKNVKRRVEHVTPTLNWKDIGGGFVSLDEEGIE